MAEHMLALAQLPAILPMADPVVDDSVWHDKLNTITAWVTGLGAALLFFAFLISIGKTGLDALRRGEYISGTRPLIILLCAIVLAALTPISVILQNHGREIGPQIPEKELISEQPKP